MTKPRNQTVRFLQEIKEMKEGKEKKRNKPKIEQINEQASKQTNKRANN